MQFDSFAEFIAMGRHGFYVWLAYGLSALIVIYNVLAPLMRRRKLMKEQAQRIRRERRKDAASSPVSPPQPEKDDASST